MQSDLGGEGAVPVPARPIRHSAYFPYVGVQRTNQEKRGCGTRAGFEAEVKIKLPMTGEPSRAVFRLWYPISSPSLACGCRLRVCLAMITLEMKGVIPLRRCRERNGRKATAREKSGLMQVTATYSTAYHAAGYSYTRYIARPETACTDL